MSLVKVEHTRNLLERCVRKFQDFPEYKNDERFLKICIQYADCVEDPRDMYKFMKAKKIGLKLCAFWTVSLKP